MLPTLALALLAYNALVALVYGYDKWQATRGGWRVPEARLLGLAALGALALGAWAGMQLVRHKTRKPRFRYGVPVMLLVQIALAGWVLVTFR